MYANAGNSVDVSRKVGAEFLESSKAIKVAWQGPFRPQVSFSRKVINWLILV